MAVNIRIPSLGNKFQDYRNDIPGDSYNFGPTIIAGKVRYFALHHSVTAQTAKGDGDWKSECNSIARSHIAQGWAGIGYRFVICSDGTVVYVGDLSHGGAAVTGNNDIIFSACLVGDFTKELPTAMQVHSAHVLTDWFINHMPQYPQIDSWNDLIGHKDAAELLRLPGATPTACPGSNWRALGDSLRDRVIADRWQGYPWPEPPSSPSPLPSPPMDCEKQIAGLNARITELTNQLTIATAEVVNHEEQVGRLKAQVTEEVALRESLLEQANEATKKLEETARIYEGSLTTKQKAIDEQGRQLGEKGQEIALLQIENQKLKTGVLSGLSFADLFAALAKKIVNK